MAYHWKGNQSTLFLIGFVSKMDICFVKFPACEEGFNLIRQEIANSGLGMGGSCFATKLEQESIHNLLIKCKDLSLNIKLSLK